MSTQAMEREEEGSPDVARAAERLARPSARASLLAKRTIDVLLAAAMLAAVLPLLVVVFALLTFAGEGWLEQRRRLGRNGDTVTLLRFKPLPGGAFGRWLDQIGARDIPLLFAVLRGRLSFVGPQAVAPGTEAGHTGPRRLMAPGLIGPAQRRCGGDTSLDDAYVERWSLWMDALLLAGRCPNLDHQRVSKSAS